MMYLANISGTKQPTQMVTRIASPVASRCTSPSSSVAISHREGLPPLGTSLTMSHSNALPAIFSEAENSGFLAEILTCKSPAALRNLCNKRSKVEATRLANYETYMSVTSRQPRNMHKERKSPLTSKQRERYDELRAERFEIMEELAEASKVMYASRWSRFQKVSHKLYMLTKHHGYAV